jgi:hypothetical protein
LPFQLQIPSSKQWWASVSCTFSNLPWKSPKSLLALPHSYPIGPWFHFVWKGAWLFPALAVLSNTYEIFEGCCD